MGDLPLKRGSLAWTCGENEVIICTEELIDPILGESGSTGRVGRGLGTVNVDRGRVSSSPADTTSSSGTDRVPNARTSEYLDRTLKLPNIVGGTQKPF